MKSVNMRESVNEKSFSPNADNRIRRPENPLWLKIIFWISFVLIIPIIFYIVWYIKTKNYFIELQTRINQQASGIDIQLAKRRDTLVKTYESVKGYLRHEKDIQENIAKLRSQAINPENRGEVASQIENLTSQFKISFENYPDLKANTIMIDFMNTIEDLEREIAAARRLYNSDVQRYNQQILSVPGTIVSYNNKLETFPLFVASAQQREDVEIKF
ncbi:LemA family protein [[Mycoplasma] mobile]|uniref:Expressed protein n=1 Tax=Mycoplasma mobile (strain ATCC 43663 / 163K / NCTC 11711) TaxID=267748 RepID=Q6KH70_MYCM1|nr:LemA family protein [[Mycoplasma] mobile]AAT28060.1 expressed protein [Mycoplasma mobile 163K]